MSMNKIIIAVCILILGQLFVPLLSGTARADPGKPDLTLTADDIVFSEDKPLYGDTVLINATIHNEGSANASSVRVRFYDGPDTSGVTIGSDQILDSVPVNGTAVARVNWSTAAVANGTHYIYVSLDPANALSEENESNNVADRSIWVNQPPSAVIDANVTTAYTNEQLYFNATASSDPDGNIVTCYWNFDDGNDTKGINVQHSWGDDGVYNVTLLVTDNDGGTATDTLTVTILNQAPIAIAFDQTVYTLDTVTFDSANSTDSDGYIASASWALDNGTVLSGKKVTTVYPQDGAYAVTLTVTDDDGDSNYTIFYVTVYNRDPVPVMNASAKHINASESITFDAYQSYDMDGYITNYTWIFTGGIKEYGVKITHRFGAENGSQDVTLAVVDDDGAVASASLIIRIGNLIPVAIADMNTVLYTYANDTFDASKSYDPDGNIENYTWNFGDGTLSNDIIALHYWMENGSYNVTLLVTDNDGATAVVYTIVTVLNQPPSAYFPDSIVGSYQNFTLNGSYCHDNDGYIVNFTWNLGNGAFLYGSEVVTMWYKRGTYEMVLAVRDNDGATAACTFNVTVTNNPPKAGFGFTPANPAEQQNVTFNASTSSDLDGYITNFNWNFGDGNFGTGVATKHAYMANGTFRVTLIVTDNDGGTDSIVQNITISIYNPPPVPSFITSPEFPTTTDYVQFDASTSYDIAPGYIRRYDWNWGDGNNSQLLISHITHRFLMSSYYNVTLTVTDDMGARTSLTKMLFIAPGQNHPPAAVIYASVLTQVSGKTINFDGSASYDPDGSIVNYTWDFGDGTSAYFTIVTHSFNILQNTSRNFTVTLTVTDDLGLSTNASQTVTITPVVPPNIRPRAVLTAAPTTVYTSQLVRLSAAGSADPDGTIPDDGYSWSFGDGELGAGLEVFHRYVKPGIYVVLLTVKDNLGSTGSATETIYVMNIPPIARAGEDTSTITLENVVFSGAASSDPDGEVVQYKWDFGDGTHASGPLVSREYQHSGTYKVSLMVTDDSGATSSASINVTVQNRLPVAALVGSNATAYAGDPAMFDGSRSTDSDGRIVQYAWDFGDGSKDNGSLVSHMFTLPGTYTVILTVTDDSGGTSEANMTVVITKKPTVNNPAPQTHKGFIPGFELIAVIAALSAVALIASRRRDHGPKR